MTDRQAFLNAVIDRPDDDLLRLVFADFLEETGDPDRAEFIRLHVEQAGARPDDTAWQERQQRINELLLEHDRHWRIPELRGVQYFHRGFVEEVVTDAAWLLAVPDERFDETPVRDLQVRNAAGHLRSLALLSWLWRVERLDMRNAHLGTGGRLAQFFDTARLDRLTALSVRNCVLWADELRELASYPACRRLTFLDVSGNQFGEAGADVLANNTGFGNLETLIARADGLQFVDCFHGEAARALAESPVLTRLHTLDLRGHHIGDAGFIDLVTSPNAATLRVLGVGANDIGETGDSAIQALRAARHLTALRVLRLNGNAIDRLSADALANWEHLPAMELVDLSRCRFGPGARRLLEESPWAIKFRFEDV